jgi:hypothetical protein
MQPVRGRGCRRGDGRDASLRRERRVTAPMMDVPSSGGRPARPAAMVVVATQPLGGEGP